MSIQKIMYVTQSSLVIFFSIQGMSNSDKGPIRIGQVTSRSCALVRTKSCCSIKDTRTEDNARLERIESPRGSRSGSSSPRVNRRVRAASNASSTDSMQPSVSVLVLASK